jgi:hypothetical protein
MICAARELGQNGPIGPWQAVLSRRYIMRGFLMNLRSRHASARNWLDATVSYHRILDNHPPFPTTTEARCAKAVGIRVTVGSRFSARLLRLPEATEIFMTTVFNPEPQRINQFISTPHGGVDRWRGFIALANDWSSGCVSATHVFFERRNG